MISYRVIVMMETVIQFDPTKIVKNADHPFDSHRETRTVNLNDLNASARYQQLEMTFRSAAIYCLRFIRNTVLIDPY